MWFQLHFVHWNKKYGTPEQALGLPDGLAVLGIFMEIGEEHQEFDKIVQALANVQNKDEECCISDLGINCNSFFPDDYDYWTYEGSLTTPPLAECVIWHVFQNPIQVSEDQIQAMRSLNFDCEDSEAGKMVNNYRPPCPLNDRSVRVLN